MDGEIKISNENVRILKGMNNSYLTSTKDHDYRFISRLLLSIFKKAELAQSYVSIKGAGGTNLKYKQLDAIKFDFIKCNYIIMRILTLN